MLEEITEALRDYKGDPALTVTEQTTFDELNLDSLETVELIMKLEEHFGVSIDMSGDIGSVGDLMAAVKNAA